MIDSFAALIVDAGKRLAAPTLSTLPALASVPNSQRAPPAVNLLCAVTIGLIAFGHLPAVTVKPTSGMLEGSAPLVHLICIAPAVPAG